MDLQTVVDAMAEQERQKTFDATDQLTLGELTLLVGQADDEKPVVFDDAEYMPTSLGSWRGSYSELAIRYDETDLDAALTAGKMHMLLDGADGQQYRGYKGGDFTMSSTTPVWVANRGTSTGFIETSGMNYQGVIDVTETDECVVIETAEVKF